MNEWEWHLLEDKPPLDNITIAGVAVRRGDRVRLRPREGGDVLDLALAGKIATVESIEQDYEGKFHLSVVVDDDPGRDIGLMRQPGHRFFFNVTEIEPLDEDRCSATGQDENSDDSDRRNREYFSRRRCLRSRSGEAVRHSRSSRRSSRD